MTLANLMNQLEEAGHLTVLYKSGVVGISAYANRDIYLCWQTLRASIRYSEDNASAVRQVAEKMEVPVPTVYRAVAAMGKAVL
ncbi:hypothetical protein [Hymenobacter cellulosilyticus]|uniref:Uncharacterized protein n=1 Tax=Hymenobacter cellulosilyticus TaxID=2932248 RepID=A0A8T9Q3F2_9BACT|nr:hypothetical protein [Hymenobacter cellulosilyticus]UOQ70981.1 hypothetical protein MUN79_20230 [Hymenobacter cellulosilyticus]